MPARTKNKGLIYLRRSSGRQESTLAAQLEWAIGEAGKLDVQVDASLADLDFMQSKRLSSYKSIRLDDAITGADLERPGFLAIKADTAADKTVSHVFFLRRDRLARPEDASAMVATEKVIRQQGVTFVMRDKIAGPLNRGLVDIGEELAMWMDFYESGEFLRKHAERVITAKIALAKGGYWAGGRAPYGFVRVLVDAQGKILEELADGRRVRQQGCHVRIMPKDEAKIAIWIYILDWKHKGWGASRIASHLNDLGIPSPDAGRTRTDHGVKHLVSGKWGTRSVLELCRNPAITGVVELGRRSDGAHRRIGREGPRLLTDEDRDVKGNPKLIHNDKLEVISAPTGFGASYDLGKWSEVRQQIEQRGASQRNISRSRDLSRYPLATRVVDLTDGCGSIMYGRTSGKKSLYTCGRYMRTCSAECENNSVDAEALLELAVSTLRRLAVSAGERGALRRRLEARAQAESQAGGREAARSETAFLESKRNQLLQDVQTAERRMAVERDDQRYEAIARQYDQLRKEVRDTEAKLEAARRYAAPVVSIDDDVEAAMGLFDQITDLTTDESARSSLIELVNRLGLRVGLTFTASIKGSKREVRRLAGGIMTFNDAELPVPLFGRSRIDSPPGDGRDVPHKETASSDTNCSAQGGVVSVSGDEMPETAPPGLVESQQEGVSYTKVNRGDRRCTFLNDSLGTRLLWSAIAQTIDFTADTLFAIGG